MTVAIDSTHEKPRPPAGSPLYTQGILWGFILHAVLYAMSGRSPEISATMWVLAILSVGLLLIEHGRV